MTRPGIEPTTTRSRGGLRVCITHVHVQTGIILEVSEPVIWIQNNCRAQRSVKMVWLLKVCVNSSQGDESADLVTRFAPLRLQYVDLSGRFSHFLHPYNVVLLILVCVSDACVYYMHNMTTWESVRVSCSQSFLWTFVNNCNELWSIFMVAIHSDLLVRTEVKKVSPTAKEKWRSPSRI